MSNNPSNDRKTHNVKKLIERAFYYIQYFYSENFYLPKVLIKVWVNRFMKHFIIEFVKPFLRKKLWVLIWQI